MNREKLTIYRCPICETVVEVLDPCGLELICCGPEMVALTEKSGDGTEHVPMIFHLGSGIQVVVGDGRHPMTADHRIAWIELICDGKRQRQFFDPGQWPVAFFEMTGRKISARAYCTLDGLWKAERRCKEASGLLWPELQACVAAM